MLTSTNRDEQILRVFSNGRVLSYFRRKTVLTFGTTMLYLRASHLAHIPKQLAWVTAKRGIQATRVRSSYTSQACSVCYYVDRANRPDQQTFCCQVCGFTMHADEHAAINIQSRLEDNEL